MLQGFFRGAFLYAAPFLKTLQPSRTTTHITHPRKKSRKPKRSEPRGYCIIARRLPLENVKMATHTIAQDGGVTLTNSSNLADVHKANNAAPITSEAGADVSSSVGPQPTSQTPRRNCKLSEARWLTDMTDLASIEISNPGDDPKVEEAVAAELDVRQALLFLASTANAGGQTRRHEVGCFVLTSHYPPLVAGNEELRMCIA